MLVVWGIVSVCVVGVGSIVCVPSAGCDLLIWCGRTPNNFQSYVKWIWRMSHWAAWTGCELAMGRNTNLSCCVGDSVCLCCWCVCCWCVVWETVTCLCTTSPPVRWCTNMSPVWKTCCMLAKHARGRRTCHQTE